MLPRILIAVAGVCFWTVRCTHALDLADLRSELLSLKSTVSESADKQMAPAGGGSLDGRLVPKRFGQRRTHGRLFRTTNGGLDISACAGPGDENGRGSHAPSWVQGFAQDRLLGGVGDLWACVHERLQCLAAPPSRVPSIAATGAGKPCLEAAAAQFDRWLAPVPGTAEAKPATAMLDRNWRF